MSEEIPKTLGRYEIQKELGRGMMGIVYRANDPDLGRLVALKTIKLAFAIPDNEKAAFEKRFLAEARAAAGLQHPGIVVVHDFGRDAASATVYIALEYLEGHTLAEATADGTPMDWRQALRITEKLAEALHHAHAKGIVHRDIKPANIMLMASSGHPKVMDFGIAKLPASTLTTAGEFFGTPSFMSPEQAGGQTDLDGRSDLFSLGCVLYQLLTGKRAFDGGTLPAILMRVMKDDPAPPSQAVPGLPPALDLLVGKALAKDKAHRYQSGQQMAEDMQDILAGRPARHAGAGAVVTAVAASTDQADTAPTPGLATGRLSEVLSVAAGTSMLRRGPAPRACAGDTSCSSPPWGWGCSCSWAARPPTSSSPAGDKRPRSPSPPCRPWSHPHASTSPSCIRSKAVWSRSSSTRRSPSRSRSADASPRRS